MSALSQAWLEISMQQSFPSLADGLHGLLSMEVTTNKDHFQSPAVFGGAGVALQTWRRSSTTQQVSKAGDPKLDESTLHSGSTACTPCPSFEGDE